MSAEKLLAENRRARFDYEILETIEAGIVLTGQEVKSAKNGRAQIAGSHVMMRDKGAFLVGAEIPPYQPKNAPQTYDPSRSRQLLLNHKEIAMLKGKLHEKGLALIPLRLYVKRGIIKIALGLARSRKTHDKRELLKKRADIREMRTSKRS